MECPDLTALATMIPDARTPLHYRLPPVPVLLSAVVLIVCAEVGGAGYPLGYLLWSGLIPYHGLERGKTIAEWLVWIPFGGATIVALWWLAGLLALRLCRH